MRQHRPMADALGLGPGLGETAVGLLRILQVHFGTTELHPGAGGLHRALLALFDGQRPRGHGARLRRIRRTEVVEESGEGGQHHGRLGVAGAALGLIQRLGVATPRFLVLLQLLVQHRDVQRRAPQARRRGLQAAQPQGLLLFAQGLQVVAGASMQPRQPRARIRGLTRIAEGGPQRGRFLQAPARQIGFAAFAEQDAELDRRRGLGAPVRLRGGQRVAVAFGGQCLLALASADRGGRPRTEHPEFRRRVRAPGVPPQGPRTDAPGRASVPSGPLHRPRAARSPAWPQRWLPPAQVPPGRRRPRRRAAGQGRAGRPGACASGLVRWLDRRARPPCCRTSREPRGSISIRITTPA